MNFEEGKTLLVDKPYEWTSFDVVNKLRWKIKNKIKKKKIKVGHAGTLDPLATGLLIICTGKHTKLIEGFINDKKTYTGTFLIGKTTPSYDLETDYDRVFDFSHITDEQIESVRKSFLGIQNQVPPIFSAKKVGGKKAYDFAREGKELELKPNTIEIFKFNLNTNRFPEIDFEIQCSKGTYIRSIANDFGLALNSGATLISLKRTQSGNFSIDNAKSVDEWINDIECEDPI
jgi:tRNA pseudouridine55 synthase